MAIIGALPNTISNGQPIDAVPVMADFNWIVSQVNTNAGGLANPNIFTLVQSGVPATAAANFPTASQVQAGLGWSVQTGSANAIVLTPVVPCTAYQDGQEFVFVATTTNTTAATVLVSALTTLPIQSEGLALVGGELVAGKWYRVLVASSGTTAQLTRIANPPSIGELQRQAFTAVTTAGTAPAYTIAPSPAISAYVAGISFDVTFNAVNAGADTLQINGLASPPNLVKLVSSGSYVNVVAGDLTAGLVSNVVLISPTQALVRNLVATFSSVQIQPITATASAGVLTCQLNPTSLDFRSSTLGSGTVNTRTVSTARSVVFPAGATLGTVSGNLSRIAVLAIDNAGTVECAVVNVSGGNNLDESTLITTVASSNASSTANVFYSTTARTSVPFRVVGYVESTQSTAGVWNTAPSTIQGAGGLSVNKMTSLGSGQSWVDKTGSRATGTTYYNLSSKAIQISLNIKGDGGSTSTFTINGVTVFSVLQAGNAIGNYSGIIPPFATYALTLSGNTITSWLELA